MTAFVANTNILELTGLKGEVTGNFVNDAVVTATVKDSAGVEVPGVSWPVPMNYVALSDGDYQATIGEVLPLVAGRRYTAFIEANAGIDRIGHWELQFRPETRRSQA